MPILIVASVLLQFFCLVHLVRTGRPYYWIWLILIGSFLGSAVYIITQVIPELRNDPASRKLVRNVQDRIDPERQRRRIAQQLDVADTVDNRRKLAEECMRLGDYANAAELYQSVLKGIYASDAAFLLGLAQAQAGQHQYAAARDTLDTLIKANPDFRSDDGHFLYARCLEELGEHARALEEYQVLSTSYPGEEARLRYGLLLKQAGRTDEARQVFEDMLKRARVAPKYYRRKEKEFLDAAQKELAIGS
ncbi:pentatricopeptide repeat protein [Tahibacter aquaticus]|uniref:Pentatricopeptide repeat protein n=1 Tax=Tahibacter aquaticus TaxID=520092 RepID=A0A4R6YSP6_9GAMM|nr:tetratricopeptide repeat protein [Tahibacter aquaticus]TDR41279.1 pentatricopeptide repeat protein [Tahibacter aquaticus]